MSDIKYEIKIDSIVLNDRIGCLETECNGKLENIEYYQAAIYDDTTQCYQCDKCGDKYEVALTEPIKVKLDITPYIDEEGE